MIRDLSLAANALVPPRVVLFDWHATLVDTLDDITNISEGLRTR